MLNRSILLIVFIFGAVEIQAQYSVRTINVDRQFYDWKDSGVTCDQNVTKYYYALKDEMNTDIKQQIRYCGGSVYYIGIRNEIHLYSQNINVTCDSVSNILKKDINFINLLPSIIEEKLSYEIYNETGLYYIDSINKIFGASVGLNVPVSDTVYNILKACVDSIDTTGNRCHVYGTRNEIICIANKCVVIGVNDIKKERPVTIKRSLKKQVSNQRKSCSFLNNQINLNGRVNTIGKQSFGITIINGKANLNQKSK